LVATTEVFVTQSPAGYFVSELDQILHLPVKEPLLQLAAQGRVCREIVDGLYLYCACNSRARQQQLQARQALLESALTSATASGELQAAIILFASLLDERQRRLFCGRNRSSWAAIAKLPISSTWTRTPLPKDAVNSWPRTWMPTGFEPSAEDASQRKKNA
jgi:hypothetical protein